MYRVTSILIFCVAVLLGLGMITIYSSSMNMELHRSAVGSYFLRSQMIWGAFGFVGCAITAAIPYRKWKPAAPWILGFSILLLILVFVPHIGWAATRTPAPAAPAVPIAGLAFPTFLTFNLRSWRSWP